MGSNAGASHRIFQAALFSQIDELLFELILKVGDEDESNRIFDKQHVNLPLMSNECEKEDLMLAAAFAFGDEDLIQMVALRFTKHKLGIGLKKFSSNSILRIINILESMEEEPLVDMRSLTMFVSFGLDDTSGFRSGRPVVKLLPNDFVYWEQLHEEAEEFGFHVIPVDQMRVKE